MVFCCCSVVTFEPISPRGGVQGDRGRGFVSAPCDGGVAFHCDFDEAGGSSPAILESFAVTL